MKKMVVGLVEKRETAQAVVDDLKENGFDRSDIGYVARDEQGEYAEDRKAIGGVERGAQKGAAIGGGLGLLGGFTTIVALGLTGAGTLALVGAGPIVMTLASAGIGAFAGGLFGAITHMGVPEEDARYFAAGVHQGDILVTVKAAPENASKAEEIMNRHGAVTRWDDKRGEQRKKRLDENAEKVKQS
ncbi:hypothetical protein [Geoalkalibacter halelectricus]|uniref:hypothetical protein n=1 Tax=Geoalkalibacter halelectricus TaxID=2847045 RepID=UPI003D24F53F